ncbi:MAG: hypothetical protein V5B33_13835 [Candidatus Accumulibacter sp. UW20]|jgi:hypothetical protein
MRALAWLLALILLPLLAGALLLFTALDHEALVSRGETLSQESIAEARRLLASNDPRRLRADGERTAMIPAALIDAAINHLASRRWGSRGAFLLADDGAEIRLTLPVAGFSGGRYVNLRAAFAAAEAGAPQIVRASIGGLPIPIWLARSGLAVAIDRSGLGDEWQLGLQAIRRLSFEPARGIVEVTYLWQGGLLEQARSLAFRAEDIARLAAAQKALAGLLAPHPARAKVPLSQILPPLLICCGDPSAAQNRAALLVLAAYLTGNNLAVMLPEARHWPPPRRLRLTLLGRHDLAQHFGVSAALAAWAGEPAANALGLYKEIEDAQGGSGFSFGDLAADRAGTRLGELAASEPSRLRQAMRGPVTDTDLVPMLDGLPEPLAEAAFRSRFGDPDDPAYRRVTAEIERRLDALPLYR